MAPGNATDFNKILNADRQRRKNQALATEIFSKNRRQSAPGGGTNNHKPAPGASLASRIGGSLASRVGVVKRTASTTQKNATARSNLKPAAGNVNAEWTHDLHTLNNPSDSRVAQAPQRAPNQPRTRTERLYASLSSSASSPALNSQFNVVGAAKTSKGISIKGLAGPYIVMAKNFAQGTTADDIESAMTPVGGVCLSCRIITERPNVIAEIIFESKEGADNVVSTFNNQNADGNLLHVYHKVGSAAKVSTSSKPPVPLGPRAEREILTIDDSSDNTRPGRGGSDRYDPRSDRRRGYDARDKLVDGSFGFDERMDTDDNYDNGGSQGLYSDNLVNNRGRNRGRGNDHGRGNR